MRHDHEKVGKCVFVSTVCIFFLFTEVCVFVPVLVYECLHVAPRMNVNVCVRIPQHVKVNVVTLSFSVSLFQS